MAKPRTVMVLIEIRDCTADLDDIEWNYKDIECRGGEVVQVTASVAQSSKDLFQSYKKPKTKKATKKGKARKKS